MVTRLVAVSGVRWTDEQDEQVVDPEEARRYSPLQGYEREISEVAPPGYSAALVMRAVLMVLHDVRLALPFDRNVHAAQALDWIRPLRVGERLTTQAWVESVRLRERAVFFDVATISTDDAGDRCLTGVSTHAVRHG